MTTRQEMICDATAHNKFLKPKVHLMSNFELLCHCHPIHRYVYAKRLFDSGKLSEKSLKEFVPKKTTYNFYTND